MAKQTGNLNVKCSPEELAAIKEAAAAERRSVSNFVLVTVLDLVWRKERGLSE